MSHQDTGRLTSVEQPVPSYPLAFFVRWSRCQHVEIRSISTKLPVKTRDLSYRTKYYDTLDPKTVSCSACHEVEVLNETPGGRTQKARSNGDHYTLTLHSICGHVVWRDDNGNYKAPEEHYSDNLTTAQPIHDECNLCTLGRGIIHKEPFQPVLLPRPFSRLEQQAEVISEILQEEENARLHAEDRVRAAAEYRARAVNPAAEDTDIVDAPLVSPSPVPHNHAMGRVDESRNKSVQVSDTAQDPASFADDMPERVENEAVNYADGSADAPFDAEDDETDLDDDSGYEEVDANFAGSVIAPGNTALAILPPASVSTAAVPNVAVPALGWVPPPGTVTIGLALVINGQTYPRFVDGVERWYSQHPSSNVHYSRYYDMAKRDLEQWGTRPFPRAGIRDRQRAAASGAFG